MNHRRIIAAAMAPLCAGLALTAGPSDAGHHVTKHLTKGTTYAFKSSGFGTRVVGGKAKADSSTTGYTAIGCTNQAGRSHTNNVGEATLPGLGRASDVRTRVWTTAHKGVVASHSTHEIGRLSLAQSGIGVALADGDHLDRVGVPRQLGFPRHHHDPSRRADVHPAGRPAPELPSPDAGPADHHPGPGHPLRRPARHRSIGYGRDGEHLRAPHRPDPVEHLDPDRPLPRRARLRHDRRRVQRSFGCHSRGPGSRRRRQGRLQPADPDAVSGDLREGQGEVRGVGSTWWPAPVHGCQLPRARQPDRPPCLGYVAEPQLAASASAASCSSPAWSARSRSPGTADT